MVIFKNEYIEITQKNQEYFLESFRRGMSLGTFKQLMEKFPQIEVSSYLTVKNILEKAPQSAQFFGSNKERIYIEVSEDKMRAYLTLGVSEDEFAHTDREVFIQQIKNKLKEKGIMFGIKEDVLLNALKPNKRLLIAEGIPVEHGRDSEVRMFKLEEPRPKAVKDGKVDHYDLNLINKVKKGEWLGERIDPTEGKPGIDVYGKEIKPIQGRLIPLLYDKKTVREVIEDGKTVLYSKINGAVNFKGDTITVSNFLEIMGDVDFKTGNVDFDGFLSVKGTVEDNFSVCSDDNLEILGEYGVGSANIIESRNGSIYIRGGIAGKNKAVIKCKQNLYAKYISDATVLCEGTVHIGFYCINSDIMAKQVIVDSSKGRIFGGKIVADIKVDVPELGSKSERRTIVKINGFDSIAMKAELDNIIQENDKFKKQLTQIKQLIEVYKDELRLNKEQYQKYEKLLNHYSYLMNEIRENERKIKDYKEYLKTPGEGAVIIRKKCYPKVRIQIRDTIEEIREEEFCKAFYYAGGKINKM